MNSNSRSIGRNILITAVLLLFYPALGHSGVVLWDTDIKGYYGKCVDVRGASSTDGAAIQMWDCHGVPQQRWKFHDSGLIQSRKSWKCLSLTENRNGADIVQKSCNKDDWKQRWDTKSYWSIPTPYDPKGIKHSTGKCLDVEGPSKANGTPVQVWDCGGFDNQIFAVVVNQSYFPSHWRNKTIKEAMCYSSSSCEREYDLRIQRQALLEKHARSKSNTGYPTYRFTGYVLDHHNVGSLLWDLSSKRLTTIEKVYVWNSIANQANHGSGNPYGYNLTLVNNGVHWASKDSFDSWSGGYLDNTYKHTIVPFWDGYHGDLAKYDDPQSAFNVIWRKEKADAENQVRVINKGDASASFRTYYAFREFRRWGDSFGTFAYVWNGLHNSKGDNFCPNRVYEQPCPVLDGLENTLSKPN